MKNTKTKLSLGVAGIALAAGFSTPSQAACTVSADTVTCDALSTVAEVEAALASVAGDDVTLINESTGEIVQPDNVVNSFRTGAIAVDNAGDVGTPAAPVGFDIRGDVTESGNTVDFVNSGTITNRVAIQNIGGNVNFVSTGDIQSTSFWGVLIEGVGAFDVQIDGSVGTATDGVTPSNLRAVGGLSRRIFTPTAVTTVDTVGTATVTTTTSAPGSAEFEGSTVDIDIGAGANVGSVFAVSLGGSSIDIAGQVGATDQYGEAWAYSNYTNNDVTTINTVDGADYQNERYTESTAVGGEASIAIADTGHVYGDVNARGTAGANVTVDGAVGQDGSRYRVAAFSVATDGSDALVFGQTGDIYFEQYDRLTTSVGGVATVVVSDTASANANVIADGDGGASITVNSLLGEAGSLGVVEAYATAETTTDGYAYATDSATGNFESQSYNTATAIPSDASVTIGPDGSVARVTARANGNVAVDVDGSVDNWIDAIALYTNRSDEFFNAYDAATDTSTSSSQQLREDVGGTVDVTIGADASVGPIYALGRTEANLVNDGTIDNSVYVYATGRTTEQTTSEISSPGLYERESAYRATSAGGTASFANNAGGLIGLDPTAPVSVFISGQDRAEASNAGRINGYLTVGASSSENTYSEAYESSFETDATTGVFTSQASYAEQQATTNLGGDALLSNALGGIITHDVNVGGSGSATNINEGAVIGRTSVTSTATDSSYAYAWQASTVDTPGAGGGVVYQYSEQYSEENAESGGDVVGVYAGTNGAVQFGPSGGASDGSVSQNADGDSSALLTGLIIGDFNGTGFRQTTLYNSEYEYEVVYDEFSTLRSEDQTNSWTRTRQAGDSESSLTIDGGRLTGSASLNSNALSALVIDGGGLIEGSAFLNATGNSREERDGNSAWSYVYDDTGAFVSYVSSSENNEDLVNGTGAVSIAIEDGAVAESVYGNAAGGGANVLIGADGAVGGWLLISAAGEDRQSSSASTFETDGTTQQFSSSNFNARQAAGGDVDAEIAGVIGNDLGGALDRGSVGSASGGGVQLTSNAGNVSALVTGQVSNTIFLQAAGFDQTNEYSETLEDGLRTSYESSYSSTAVGGTASLVADAADPTKPVNFGDVYVAGRAGSNLTVTPGTVIAGERSFSYVDVGGLWSDTAGSFSGEYTGGTLIGSTETYSEVTVGGPASVTNNGQIGYGNYAIFDNTNVLVSVTSVTSAELVNGGQIFGDVEVTSLGQDISATTVREDIGDVTETRRTTADQFAIGGTADLENSGLITGDASLAAADGTAVNNGVIRGTVAFGQSVANYSWESLDTLTQVGTPVLTDLPAPFVQNYVFNQNGLVGNGIMVAGAFSSLNGTEYMTSAIDATINLNNGSVTGAGIYAEYDEETGERYTATDVNLNGSGYLGLGDAALDELGEAFASYDQQIADWDGLDRYFGGARVLGVDMLTKTGSGTFLITGAGYEAASPSNAFADYTLDIGTLANNGGELQLALTDMSDDIFGIRGNVVNRASLVVGDRTSQGVDGISVYQLGNFNQTSAGSLAIGITPTLNMGGDFSNYSDSFWTLDGNLTLDGNVELVTSTTGMFVDGQRLDFMSVSGSVTESASASLNGVSNFVDFDVMTRTEGGRTIVFVQANRAGFDTVANSLNAAAAGSALTASIADVWARMGAGGFGANGEDAALAADMAGILMAFDSELTREEVAVALDEIASGEVYGSLGLVSTTAVFADALSHRRTVAGSNGVNVWFAPGAQFLNVDGDPAVGSRELDVEQYGGSFGFGWNTGAGEIGIGVGLGQTEANTEGYPIAADAETWMAGIYARHGFGNLAVGGSLVYGWSDWDVVRDMPFIARTAQADFRSTELRGNLMAAYRLPFGSSAWAAPFGEIELRKVDFDGFTEEGAQALNLTVEESDDSILTPTLGLRFGTEFGGSGFRIRPEGSVSYSFKADVDTARTVALAGAPNNSFRLQGADNSDYFTVGAGLFGEFGGASSVYLRGSLSTGDNVSGAAIMGGVIIGF